MRLLRGLLLLAGGAWLEFWPIGSSSGGTPATSFWQAHDLCSSGIGQLGQFFISDMASSCTTVTLVWLVGLLVILLGVVVTLSALVRAEEPRSRQDRGVPRPPSSPPPPVAPPPAPAPAAPPPDPDPAFATPVRPVLPPRSRRRRRNLPLPADRRATWIAGALVAVLGIGIALVNFGPLSGPPSVPVVACATTYGGYPPAPASLPATTREPFVSGSLASGLAAYVSADGSDSQLAPRGWICSASFGADGYYELSIHPLVDPSATVTLDGGFNGPGIDMAAPLFPDAHTQCLSQFAGMDTGQMCPGPPAGEVLDRRSSRIVLFSDPPGVQGSAMISGAYTVLGAMTYSSPSTATRVACAMPNSSRGQCLSIVDATVASWNGQH